MNRTTGGYKEKVWHRLMKVLYLFAIGASVLVIFIFTYLKFEHGHYAYYGQPTISQLTNWFHFLFWSVFITTIVFEIIRIAFLYVISGKSLSYFQILKNKITLNDNKYYRYIIVLSFVFSFLFNLGNFGFGSLFLDAFKNYFFIVLTYNIGSSLFEKQIKDKRLYTIALSISVFLFLLIARSPNIENSTYFVIGKLKAYIGKDLFLILIVLAYFCGLGYFLKIILKSKFNFIKLGVNKNKQKQSIKTNAHLNGVNGWLKFLCLILTIIDPLFTLVDMVKAYNSTININFHTSSPLRTFIIVNLALVIFILSLEILSGIRLWKVHPHAIRTFKIFLIVYLIYSLGICLLPFIVGFPENVAKLMSSESLKGLPRSLMFIAIWGTYITFSSRVKNTYRKEINSS